MIMIRGGNVRAVSLGSGPGIGAGYGPLGSIRCYIIFDLL
jgi:hypothetical protein